MGNAKRHENEWDRLVAQAQGIAIEAGSITTDCPHETPIDTMNPKAAFALAHEKFDRGDLTEFHGIAELDEALEDALADAGIDCGACERIKRAARKKERG